jgi:hypothetical protein
MWRGRPKTKAQNQPQIVTTGPLLASRGGTVLASAQAQAKRGNGKDALRRIAGSARGGYLVDTALRRKLPAIEIGAPDWGSPLGVWRKNIIL